MRLTNQMRDDITTKLLDSVLPKQDIKELEAQMQERAQMLVEATIPDDLKVIAAKYPGFIQLDDDVRFKRECWRDGDSWWRYDDSVIRITLDVKLPCAESFFPMEADAELESMDNQIKAEEKRRSDLKNRIKRCLASCTTTGQVARALPEAAEIVKYWEAVSLPVPVAQYEQLNAELAALKAASQ